MRGDQPTPGGLLQRGRLIRRGGFTADYGAAVSLPELDSTDGASGFYGHHRHFDFDLGFLTVRITRNLGSVGKAGNPSRRET
jgi:hypothetical protein